MELIKKKVSELIPYINNSRTHSEEQITQLVSSIKEFGFTNPILLAPDNSIIAGHGRLQAVKRLGIDEVPCIIISGLSKTQIKALIIADNQLALNAGWDLEKLSVEIEGLETDKFDLNILGFEDEFLKDLLHKENLGLTDEDAVPEVKENPKSKIGDIFVLGNHKIICEDSFNENIVIKFIENTDKKFTFTDPPYELTTKGGGILKEANSMKQIQNNNVNKFEPSNLKLYCKTNIYFHNKPLIKKYIELAENNKKSFDLCFYKKENVAPNYAGHMMTDVEYISIIGDQSPNKGLDKSLYSKLYIGKKDNDNKLSYSKPVELCEKYIKLYAKNYVIDLFLGSGSTLIACEKLNKICYGFEYNPQFIDVIIQRWQQFTGKEAIHEQTGKTYNSI